MGATSLDFMFLIFIFKGRMKICSDPVSSTSALSYSFQEFSLFL